MNAVQKTYLATLARYLHRLSIDIEQAAEPQDQDATLTGVRPSNRIDREALRVHLGELREGLAHLAALSGDGLISRSADHRIETLAAFAGVAIEDARPQRLQAYGPLENHDAKIVDGLLDELKSRITAITTSTVA